MRWNEDSGIAEANDFADHQIRSLEIDQPLSKKVESDQFLEEHVRSYLLFSVGLQGLELVCPLLNRLGTEVDAIEVCLEELRVFGLQVDWRFGVPDFAQNARPASEDIGVDGETFGRGRWLANDDFKGILEVVPVSCQGVVVVTAESAGYGALTLYVCASPVWAAAV